MEDSRDQPLEHQGHKTTYPQQQSRDHPTRRPIEVAIVSQVPPPPSTDDKSKDGGADQTPRWKKVLEIFAVSVALVVALIYGGQLYVMKGTLEEMKRSGTVASDQTWRAIANLNWQARSMDAEVKQSQEASDASERQSREALRLEERAWIVIDPQHGGSQAESGKPLSQEIKYQNIGKTPARDVREDAVAVLLDRGKGPDYAYRGRPHLHSEIGVIAPGEAPEPLTPVVAMPSLLRDQEFKPLILDEPTVIRFAKAELVLFVYGRITYDDVFETPHWVTFCAHTGAPPVKPEQWVLTCAAYNTTDQNRENTK